MIVSLSLYIHFFCCVSQYDSESQSVHPPFCCVGQYESQSVHPISALRVSMSVGLYIQYQLCGSV